MRTVIIGTHRNIEVIAHEFTIEGVPHRFIVHASINPVFNKEFTATHLETSQIIGDGDTIDEAIEEGRRRWLAADPDMVAEKLAERLAWAREKIAERGATA